KQDSFMLFNKFLLYFLLIIAFSIIQFGNLLFFTILISLAFYSMSRIQMNKFIAEFTRFNIVDVMIPKERLVCFSDLTNSRNAVYLAINSFQEFFPVLAEKK